jgi:antitoxin (DNA-binding transcriptional repressor) of toxin-antitoxin stability system
MFARVEQGEILEVTRHGKVIAVLLPGTGTLGRYSDLVTRGIIKLKTTTTDDISALPRYDIPEGVSALDTLLAERAEDDR